MNWLLIKKGTHLLSTEMSPTTHLPDPNRLFRSAQVLGAAEILGAGVLMVRQDRNFRWNNANGCL